MIDLQDLPRLESLSPIRDIQDYHEQITVLPRMTIISANGTFAHDKIIDHKTKNNFVTSIDEPITKNEKNFKRSGLHYISQKIDNKENCDMLLSDNFSNK